MMPGHGNNCPIEEALVKTKSRKSHKKHHKECEVECCIPECNPDCCTPAFQRLDKLRNVWLNANMGVTYTGGVDRAGNSISTPSETLSGNNDTAAYYFVNVVRYLTTEECGKSDQVTGWHVDTQTGSLVMYQTLYDLNLTAGLDRETLLTTTPENLTPVQLRQLKNFEPFWKLSLKAVERVQQNPKEEGNICEIHDKCGNKFLVAINRANGNQSVCDYNSQYSIVVVRLC
jgi:hypothetical protein